jgi:hypothetical protein
MDFTGKHADAFGGNIVGVTADVRDSDADGKAFDGAASQLGTVDG